MTLDLEPPYFSIITVALNALTGLKAVQASLRVQTCRDFEWIIIDGASEDGTQEWLAQTKARWISEPDNGLYDAMNKGIEKARGEYLLFLNAGDILAAPDTLETLQTIALNKTPTPDFLYGDALEELENGTVFLKKAKPLNALKSDMITHHQAMLYRREGLNGLRYDLRYRLAADYDFTLNVLKKARSVAYADIPVCIFAPGGLSHTHAARSRRESFSIRRDHKNCTLWKNCAIYMRQSLAFALKRFLPRVYAALRRRSSGNNAPGLTQTPVRADHPKPRA